ncbi:MAG: phosphate ABC transporter permease subunit PstC, partial [Burkholderiales bacterium]
MFGLVLVLLLLSSVAYYVGRRRALGAVGGRVRELHSLPGYNGLYVAIWCGLPALLLVAGWLAVENGIINNLVVADLPQSVVEEGPERITLTLNEIHNIADGVIYGEPDPAIMAAAEHYKELRSISHGALAGLSIALALGATAWGLRRIKPRLQARNAVERVITGLLLTSSTIAVLTTVGIVLSVLFESIRFFHSVPITEFLFGLEWSPQTAIRSDQVGSSGAFGAVPLFAGTMLIAFIAMLVAVPIGLMSAIYLSEYANFRFRAVAKPLLEILAGVPTVVYGFFAALTVAPFIRDTGGILGLEVASESALAAGLVMGIMIIPFVSSLSDDVINAVPQAMRDGSYGIGATRSETIKRVIFPAALPGIVGGVLLAVSRAIGETMIVVMAAGLAANLTANPLQAVTTVTVQIVTL